MTFEAHSKGTPPGVAVDQRLILEKVNLHEADFSQRRLAQFVAVESRFTACRFTGIVADYTCFGAGTSPTEYTDCTLDGSKLRIGVAGVLASCVRSKMFVCAISAVTWWSLSSAYSAVA